MRDDEAVPLGQVLRRRGRSAVVWSAGSAWLSSSAQIGTARRSSASTSTIGESAAQRRADVGDSAQRRSCRGRGRATYVTIMRPGAEAVVAVPLGRVDRRAARCSPACRGGIEVHARSRCRRRVGHREEVVRERHAGTCGPVERVAAGRGRASTRGFPREAREAELALDEPSFFHAARLDREQSGREVGGVQLTGRAVRVPVSRSVISVCRWRRATRRRSDTRSVDTLRSASSRTSTATSPLAGACDLLAGATTCTPVGGAVP